MICWVHSRILIKHRFLALIKLNTQLKHNMSINKFCLVLTYEIAYEVRLNVSNCKNIQTVNYFWHCRTRQNTVFWAALQRQAFSTTKPPTLYFKLYFSDFSMKMFLLLSFSRYLWHSVFSVEQSEWCTNLSSLISWWTSNAGQFILILLE